MPPSAPGVSGAVTQGRLAKAVGLPSATNEHQSEQHHNQVLLQPEEQEEGLGSDQGQKPLPEREAEGPQEAKVTEEQPRGEEAPLLQKTFCKSEP